MMVTAAAWPAGPALARPVVRPVPTARAWAGLAGVTRRRPFEYTEWLESRYPGTGKLVRPIAEVYVQGAYSGQEPGPEELARASKAWEQLRRPLARRVFLRGVIAARERFEELRESDCRRAVDAQVPA